MEKVGENGRRAADMDGRTLTARTDDRVT
jgi:hypothetical protein